MTKPKYDLKDFLSIKTSIAVSFSPNGKRLAVSSNLTGTSQLYIINRDGSGLEQLTFFEDSIDSATFSPTKPEIIFGMALGGNENYQLYIYDLDKKEYRKLTDSPKVRFGWGCWSRDGKYIAFSSNERNGTDFDIYTMELETGTIKNIFEKGGWCNAGGFSPSGKYLAVMRQRTNVSNEMYLVDLNNGGCELVSSSEGETSSGAPRWLPDESGFYYRTNKDRDFIGLVLFNMNDKKSKYVMEKDWDIGNPAITQDGKYLAVSVNEDGYDNLVIYSTDDMQPIDNQTMPPGTSYGFNWSRDGKYLLINAGSATSPTCSYIWSRESNVTTKITSVSSNIPEDIFIEPELIKYRSFDGLEIPALLYSPDVTKNKKVPVIINIHGGPEGQSRADFSPLTQYLLTAGYAVVFPNVRGSIGYGKKYLHLDDVEKRMDSVTDIVELHKYLSNKPEIDTQKMVLMGGSYGGFMVLAGLAFYPDLWAAGVDIVGISNFITFLENTAPYRRALREDEYGSLKNDRKFLESISPFNHVDDIKSPLFIVHGQNDPRVPLAEAEQIYKKLNDRGKTVKLLVYPDEGHGISKLKNRLDLWPQVIDFLDGLD